MGGKHPQKKQLYIIANWCLRNTFCILNMSESTEVFSKTIDYNEGFSVYFFTSFHSQRFEGPQTMIHRDNYFPIFEVINRQRMWSDTHTHQSAASSCLFWSQQQLTIAWSMQGLFLFKSSESEFLLNRSEPPWVPGAVEKGIVSHFHVPSMNCW